MVTSFIMIFVPFALKPKLSDKQFLYELAETNGLEKQYTKRHGINIGCINNRTKVSKVYFLFVTKDSNPLFPA